MKAIISHIIIIVFLLGCRNDPAEKPVAIAEKDVVFDLDRIKSEGKLVALIDFSSTSYFIYRGTAMGFEYDLLNKFAKHLDVDLVLEPIRDLDSIGDLLNQRRGDLAAANLTVTQERQQYMSFTEPLTYTSQVLIQRKPDNWRSLTREGLRKRIITDPIDLAYKKVHIRKNSSFYSRLQNLSEEIGEPIYIEEVPGDLTTEKLIEMVANGEIEYTVADQHVAQVNGAHFSNIDYSTAVSFKQKIAWALRKSSPQLLEEINNWLEKFEKTTEFAVIYNKYFKNKTSYRKRVESDFFASKSGKISRYDPLIKKYSKPLNWDWKLLASLIYQESHFDDEATSWAGAYGLMQIMPQTAERFGIDSNATPEQNIKAGVEYLKWLDERWSNTIVNKEERIKFVLASYNVGLGHIIDARNLATKYDKDPLVWDGNVADFVLKKSQSKYYRDPIVKHGYCRGSEPFNYVKDIIRRYQEYDNLINS